MGGSPPRHNVSYLWVTFPAGSDQTLHPQRQHTKGAGRPPCGARSAPLPPFAAAIELLFVLQAELPPFGPIWRPPPASRLREFSSGPWELRFSRCHPQGIAPQQPGLSRRGSHQHLVALGRAAHKAKARSRPSLVGLARAGWPGSSPRTDQFPAWPQPQPEHHWKPVLLVLHLGALPLLRLGSSARHLPLAGAPCEAVGPVAGRLLLDWRTLMMRISPCPAVGCGVAAIFMN
jgi:hypothetical protein